MREGVVAFMQVAVTIMTYNQIVLIFAMDDDGHGKGGRKLLGLTLVRGERASKRGETRHAGGRGTGAHDAG